MKAPAVHPRRMLANQWQRWLNLPKPLKAQALTQRLMGLMLLLGALALDHADVTTPSLALITSWFTLITFPTYIALMLLCGLALLLLPRLKVGQYILLTVPVALYIAYAGIATVVYLHSNLQGIVFLVLLYLKLMVSYWGYS